MALAEQPPRLWSPLLGIPLHASRLDVVVWSGHLALHRLSPVAHSLRTLEPLGVALCPLKTP